MLMTFFSSEPEGHSTSMSADWALCYEPFLLEDAGVLYICKLCLVDISDTLGEAHDYRDYFSRY
jgi:hypothetical protein